MDERIDELRERLREDPSSRLFYQLGELLRREGEDAEAVEVLRAGVEQHPFYVAAWVSLGRSLLALERLDEADDAFTEALRLDPENAVAARGRGRAAVQRGDLVEAVKALKLARALTPGDRELEDEIADVEARLAAGGLLEEPPPAPTPPPLPGPPEPAEATAAAPEAEVLETAAPAAPPLLPEAPFAEPFGPPSAVEDVLVLTEEDPFEVGPRGDSGVFMLGEDVFGAPPAAAEEPPGAPVEAAWDETMIVSLQAEEAEPAALTEPEGMPPEPAEVAEEPPPWAAEAAEAVEPTTPDADITQEIVELTSAGDLDEALAAEAGPELAPAVAEGPEEGMAEGEVTEEELFVDRWPLPSVTEQVDATVGAEQPEEAEEAGEAEPATTAELPLPTVTLARLAAEQGDVELARRTAEAVLEREPGSIAARELLDKLTAGGAAPPGSVESLRLAKIVALRRWLERVRLAAGKQVS